MLTEADQDNEEIHCCTELRNHRSGCWSVPTGKLTEVPGPSAALLCCSQSWPHPQASSNMAARLPDVISRLNKVKGEKRNHLFIGQESLSEFSHLYGTLDLTSLHTLFHHLQFQNR